MLQVVGAFKLSAPTNSTLSLKHNSVLDLYFNLFISEVEYLVQRGLVKQYRKRESNCKVLKGRLNFGKHIQKNLIHKEMLYVNHTTYDVEHRLHMILYKTIRLLKQINTNPMLNNRLGQLILNLPEMPDIYVSESVFDKLKYSRKTEIYRKAVDIAKLLLLNYHPDIKKGTNNVLALMFDMNVLWERFVYSSLYKNRGSYTVESQISKDFWLSNTRGIIKMRPDIVIRDRD
jgi:5-methylcytosine-specific restriction enzyme subunit McrC